VVNREMVIPLYSLSGLDLADLSFHLGLRPCVVLPLGLYFEYCLSSTPFGL